MLCQFFVMILISVTSIITCCHNHFGIFWLPLWYLLITTLASSDYHFGIVWLPLWHLLITTLASSDYHFGIFWLPLWHLLITTLASSDYHFGIVWLPLWHLLITTLASSDYHVGIFWLPLWHLLIHALLEKSSTETAFNMKLVKGTDALGIEVNCTRLVQRLITTLASSDYHFGIVWLPLWYL
jgi:hypothetical protein